MIVVDTSALMAIAQEESDAIRGKGVHPAGLNFCDCFAYELARHHDCPLLYVGQDFSRTDIMGVL